MSWPKEVPVLEAKDIVRGSLIGPDETRCLMGWSDYVFGCPYEISTTEEDVVYEALMKAIGGGAVSVFNDDPKNSKRKVARVWNQAMANLGYTEGNPCKPQKGRK